MICIVIGGAFLLGGPLFSRSVSTILQLVVATGKCGAPESESHTYFMNLTETREMVFYEPSIEQFTG